MQATLWIMAGASAALALVAMFADRRRMKRRDPDRPGWMPWPLVLMLAILVGALCVAFAIRS